jgi:hypothetical protein
MVAVGMLMIWAGYSVGLFGWGLVRDYDLTLAQLCSPAHPYSGAWPPASIPPTQVYPGKQAESATAAAPGGSGSSSTETIGQAAAAL